MQIYTESTHNLNAEFVPSVNTVNFKIYLSLENGVQLG